MTAAVTPVDADGWCYTARPEWSSAGESMWMRLAKFSLCNRLSVTALAALFAAEGESATNVDLRRADRWNLQALTTVLEISADDVQAGFCVGPSSPTPRDASLQLRSCPVCLESGFHAAWFQCRFVERCPLHAQPLRTGCVWCMAPVPYTLGHDLAAYPLSCATCGGAWVPGLSRPAGRCPSLERRHNRLFLRWTAYIEHVVGDESDRRYGRSDESVAARSRPARPHYLTMVNRLFDVPPPRAAELLRRPACRHPALPPRLQEPAAQSDRGSSGYAAAGWPHFGRAFAQCEHVLHKARGQLFGDVDDECERGRWRHLLASDLVASTEAMDRRTAAALGWAVTWMSSVRTLAPNAGCLTPALGLAGWLANLPQRPQGASRRRWQAQVLAWLEDDLVISASMWERVVAFMQAKGVYLLNSAMVDLPRLAQRYRM